MLTLGTAGIDMSVATVNLTANIGLAMGASQTWNVATGTSLNLNGTVAMGTSAVTIVGNGTVNVAGGLWGAAATLNKTGLGVLTFSGTSSFTGAVTLGNQQNGGGTVVLDFSGVNAPQNSGLLSSSVAFPNLSGTTINIIGNANYAVAQTFSSLTLGYGLTTITNTQSGMGVTVNLGNVGGDRNHTNQGDVVPPYPGWDKHHVPGRKRRGEHQWQQLNGACGKTKREPGQCRRLHDLGLH